MYGYTLTIPNKRYTQQPTYDVISEPIELPVSLDLVKEHLRLDGTNSPSDEYLTILIKSTRDFFQNYTGRTLISTGYRTYFDCFKQSFELARSRLITLDSFDYMVDGTLVSVPSTIYYVTAEKDYSRIIITYTYNFPTDKDDSFQSIQVEFTAGYGELDTSIPSDIKLALLNHIAFLNANRGDCSEGEQSLPINVLNIYRKYIINTEAYRG